MEPSNMRRFEHWRILKGILEGVCFPWQLVLPQCSRRSSWCAVFRLAAQQSVAVQGGSAQPVYSVVSPIGESTVTMISMVPRRNTLAGQTVCMVWNRAFKADVAFLQPSGYK